MVNKVFLEFIYCLFFGASTGVLELILVQMASSTSLSLDRLKGKPFLVVSILRLKFEILGGFVNKYGLGW